MCQVIAEIGWNHMGNMGLAEKMIQEASKAGANYAKFQSWAVKNLKPGPWDADGRRQIYEKAELDEDKHKHLMKICDDNNIEFLTSVFCKEDAERVAALGCTKVKIPSTEIANIPLLEYVNVYFNDIFISCGAATFDEIRTALLTLKKSRYNIHTQPGDKIEMPGQYANVTLLHCVSSYPCPFDKVNLPRIERLRNQFGGMSNALGLQFGYSGHGTGIHDAIASLEYGASLIEKHFTIDNDLPGRDNKFAILPHELKELSTYIRNRWDMQKGICSQYDPAEEEARNVYRGRWQS